MRMLKKLLLTGFEPFLDNPINPTDEIVKSLGGTTVGNYEIIGRILPVDFSESAKQCLTAMDEVKPNALISLGLAAGRSKITPERIAINCRDGAEDNKGVRLEDSPIETEGPAGYFSTLPIRKFVSVLNGNGFPSAISNTAGTYLCNNVMYSALHKIEKDQADMVAGFIHIPASHELAIQKKSIPSWSQHDLTEAVKLMIQMME